MEVLQRIYDHFLPPAREAVIDAVVIGLGYTAVTTTDGGIGIAFTSVQRKGCCAANKGYRDYEGQGASELLALIRSPESLHRSMALALVNALNHRQAATLPETADDGLWMQTFGIQMQTRVAMVGLFRPLVALLQERGAMVEVLDDLQGVGEKKRFYEKLGGWAQVLVLTATSLLNATTEEILHHLGPEAQTVMIGPSTPLAAEVFAPLPIHMLAGTVPVDKTGVLKAVRHGAGTPVIHRFSRKVCLPLFPPRRF